MTVPSTGLFAGQLAVGLGVGAGGSFAVIDGMSFVPDASAFAVSSSTPANGATVNGPFNSIAVTYNHPLGASATNSGTTR